VNFGTTPTTTFTVQTDSQMVVTSPAATAAGPVDIHVIGPAGQSAASPADTYTYT
jgi:hypothetical protein